MILTGVRHNEKKDTYGSKNGLNPMNGGKMDKDSNVGLTGSKFSNGTFTQSLTMGNTRTTQQHPSISGSVTKTTPVNKTKPTIVLKFNSNSTIMNGATIQDDTMTKKKINITAKSAKFVRRRQKIVQLESNLSNSVCLNDPCGTGVACFPKGVNDFICICSDGSKIKPGHLCPYIKPVNVTPPAISMSHSNQHSNMLLQGILFGSFLILILSLLSLIAYWKRSEVRRLLKINRKPKYEYDESMIKDAFYTANLANNPNYCSALPVDMFQVGSLKVPLFPKEHILFQGELGQGQFGIVYKGELIEPANVQSVEKSSCSNEKSFPGNKQTVAVKVLKSKSRSNGEVDFQREVEVAAMFKHENILSLIGIVYDDVVHGCGPWMIFEFMPHGDLAGFLRSYNKTFYVHETDTKPLNDDDMMKISIDIACGMEYLASQHFVHRDLACRNCLVGSNHTVKISDFGMSRDVYTCDYYKAGRNGAVLPIRWMAPESISYGKFTLESDVWSFGITLWEVYSFAKLPYYGSSNDEVIKQVTGGTILTSPDTCPPAIVHVLNLCWKTAQKRPTFRHIVPYLKAALANPTALQFVNVPQTAGDLTIYTQLAMNDTLLDQDSYLIPKMNSEEEYITVLSSLPV